MNGTMTRQEEKKQQPPSAAVPTQTSRQSGHSSARSVPAVQGDNMKHDHFVAARHSEVCYLIEHHSKIFRARETTEGKIQNKFSYLQELTDCRVLGRKVVLTHAMV